MEQTPSAPNTSSGRVLKSNSDSHRSLDEDRIQFIDEEYDVPLFQTLRDA